MRVDEFPWGKGISVFELRDANAECRLHGRCAFDRTPPCGCFAHWEGGAVIVGFTPGPSYEVFTAHADPKWCFRCRDFLGGEWVLLDEPPERQPTYYDAMWTRRCVRCGEEHTRFPGTADGPVYPPEDVWQASRPAHVAYIESLADARRAA